MTEYVDRLKIDEAINLVKEYGSDDLSMFLEVVKINFEDLNNKNVSAISYRKKRLIGLDNSLKSSSIYFMSTVIIHELTHIKFHLDQNRFCDDYIYSSLLAHPFIQNKKGAIPLIKEEKLMKKLTGRANRKQEIEHTSSIQEEVDAKINEIKFWKTVKTRFNLEDPNLDFWLYQYENHGFNGIKMQIKMSEEYSDLPEYSSINEHKALINSVKEIFYNLKKGKTIQNFFIKKKD